METASLDLVLLHKGKPFYPHSTAVKIKLHNEIGKKVIVSNKTDLLKQ